jgi:penicillin-binding protein 1A
MIGARAAAGVLAGAVLVAGCSLRPVNLEATRPLALRTTITAADGSMLARLYKQNRATVTLRDVPAPMIDAVLAAEDARFFEHPGYDLRAITRAAVINWREGKVVQGGSTITQQYVKNVYFRNPARTFGRKARELRLAIELEARFSKNEILERYLNTVYFGDGAYGVKAAAETYFDRDVTELTPSDAALLAGLIKAPSGYNPRDHADRALARRNAVLRRMSALGMMSPAQANRLAASPLGVLADPPKIASRQPYFVEAVKRELLSDRRFGASEDERARALYEGGLRVETTLDPRLQGFAERAIDGVLNQPGDPAAALVAIRPQSGEIVAMVGGRDWNASQVNLALGKAGGGSGRQPGSSFKPIVAATAMESGITLDARYESGPVTFVFDASSKTWTPSTGASRGLMTLSDAMVDSVNSVYARLGMQLGPGQIATQAHLMGVESKLPAVPSLALGSGEVSVLDMAAAYATIANGGTSVNPTTIRRVRTSDGAILRPQQEVVPGVVSPGNSYLLTKVLEQVITRGTGTAANIGRPAAGKTGTSNDYADAWFIGYTPQLVAAVWVGYPQGRIPMFNVRGIQVQGGTFPALIWRAFMLEALNGVPPKRFLLPPSALARVEIDPVTGLLAAPWCPGEIVKMVRDLVPREYCPTPAPSPLPLPTETPSPSPTATKGKNEDKEPSPAPSPSREPSPTPKPKPSPSQP